MALSEVLVATEVAAKTATVVGEGIKEAVNVTEIAETSKAVLNLTEAQANYLSELNIPNNTWKAMSSEVQGHHIQLIDTRMKEMGLEPSARSLEGIFDSKLVESLESEHIIKHPELLQKEGLTVEEKEALKLETGWSDRIVDYIGSMEEACLSFPETDRILRLKRSVTLRMCLIGSERSYPRERILFPMRISRTFRSLFR